MVWYINDSEKPFCSMHFLENICVRVCYDPLCIHFCVIIRFQFSWVYT